MTAPLLLLSWLLLGTEGAAPPTANTRIAVPFTEVRITGGALAERQKANRAGTIPYDFQKCDETGRISNFARAARLIAGPFMGTPYDDSDVYKVIEGASYTLATDPDPGLESRLDQLIRLIAAAQEPDGYLYTARTIDPQSRPDFFGPERWSNLAVSHELYNLGHLYEAAVAHYQATGQRSLLDVAVRSADLVDKVFGPGPQQRKDPPGHEEIELALIKLADATHEPRYRRLARFFLDQRGRPDGRGLRGPYQQDHEPVIDQREAVGHAVRAVYLYSAMTDIAAGGDAAYREAVDALWRDVISRKLYVTGGIGARHAGEAFGEAYELPNKEAYNETCAAVGLMLWSHRMYLLTGEAGPLDVLERTLFNGFLSGVSTSGEQFFYPNPLSSDGRWPFNQGSVERSPWFGTSCCPVNVARTMPQIAQWMYGREGNDLSVLLYGDSSATIAASAQRPVVKLVQRTDYPWDGRIQIQVDCPQPAEFGLRLRIPGWARNEPVPETLYRFLEPSDLSPRLEVNGTVHDLALEQGFALIRRVWTSGDTLTLDLPMPVRRVIANDRVGADRGRVAIERGPVVYCAEGIDNEGRTSDLVLPDQADLTVWRDGEVFHGVPALMSTGQRVRFDEAGMRGISAATLRLIPYQLWCSRGGGEMDVWLPRTVDLIPSPPMPTIASRARVAASHCWRNDSTAAVNDLMEPTNSNDQTIPRFTWWDHRGTKEWLQLDFAAQTSISGVDVYWFDDTGIGQCRVPASWAVLVPDGDGWSKVETGATPPTAKDRFSSVSFKPVETARIRLEVQLQPDVSGGVLELRVTPHP